MMPTEGPDPAKRTSGERAIRPALPQRDERVCSGKTFHRMVWALAPRIQDGLDLTGDPNSKVTPDLDSLLAPAHLADPVAIAAEVPRQTIAVVSHQRRFMNDARGQQQRTVKEDL